MELRASDIEPALGPDLCRAIQLLQPREEGSLGFRAGVLVEGLRGQEQPEVGAGVVHEGRVPDELGERSGIPLVGCLLSRARAQDRRQDAHGQYPRGGREQDGAPTSPAALQHGLLSGVRLLGLLDLHAGRDEVALHMREPDADVRDDILCQRQGQAPVEQVGVAVLAPPVGCIGAQPSCHAQVFAVLVDPPAQARPGIKKGLVHEFHRRLPARGLAVEGEQPCRSESVDQLPADARDVGHVGNELTSSGHLPLNRDKPRHQPADGELLVDRHPGEALLGGGHKGPRQPTDPLVVRHIDAVRRSTIEHLRESELKQGQGSRLVGHIRGQAGNEPLAEFNADGTRRLGDCRHQLINRHRVHGLHCGTDDCPERGRLQRPVEEVRSDRQQDSAGPGGRRQRPRQQAEEGLGLSWPAQREQLLELVDDQGDSRTRAQGGGQLGKSRAGIDEIPDIGVRVGGNHLQGLHQGSERVRSGHHRRHQGRVLHRAQPRHDTGADQRGLATPRWADDEYAGLLGQPSQHRGDHPIASEEQPSVRCRECREPPVGVVQVDAPRPRCDRDELSELGGKRPRRRVPVARIAGGGSGHESVEGGIEVRIPSWDGGSHSAVVPGRLVLARGAGRSRAPGQHQVDQAAEREDIGGRSGVAAVQLGRSEGVGVQGSRVVPPSPSMRCDAEVGQVRVAVSVEQHVRRLDVPVDDPTAVGEVQGVGDLCHDVSDVGECQRVLSQRIGEIAALDPAHDDVGLLGVPPVVVQRHDVRVREAGHRRGLSREPPDEVRIGGAWAPNDLDRDLSIDRGLGRPMHYGVGTPPYPGTEQVPAQGTPRALWSSQRRVLTQDRDLEFADLLGHVDAELVGHPGAMLGDVSQCLGLPARAVQRQRTQFAKALAVGVVHQQVRGLSGNVAGPKVKKDGQAVLLRSQSRLAQPGGARCYPVEVLQSVEGSAPPQGQGLVQRVQRFIQAGLPLRRRDELLEVPAVHVVGVDGQRIATGSGDDERAVLIGGRGPQPLDVGPQCRNRGCRGLIGIPHAVGEAVHGETLRAGEDQGRHDPLVPHGAHRCRLMARADPDAPENQDLHQLHLTCMISVCAGPQGYTDRQHGARRS